MATSHPIPVVERLWQENERAIHPQVVVDLFYGLAELTS